MQNSREKRSLVLVVDDDEDLQLLAGKALKKGGFSVAEAKNGREMLALFDTLRPSIILLDVIMPIMNGFEACAALRRLKGSEAVPVMMMTYLDDIDSINRAYEAGATDFITKPINWTILSHRVRYMIRASQIANELRRSEAKNSAILNVIPDLMLRMSGDGVCLEVKGSSAVNIGLPAGELQGKRIEDVMPLDLAQTAMHYVRETLRSNIVKEFELSLRTEGGLRHNEARIVTSGENEVLCIIRDVTEHKQMEENLLKIKKLEATGILAGGIAHDFNNILSVILGNVNLAQMHIQESSAAFSMLAEVEDAAMRARDLTQRFITFSTGGTPFKRTVCVEALIRETVSHLPGGWAECCECTFCDEPWSIQADQGQLRQALLNIITNAKEAMPAGGIVRIYTENVDVRPESSNAALPLKAGRYVGISIQDHGVGIPPEAMARIFDPYFSTKEKSSQKGMGLGLTVAYSIIKKHDGHIDVESGKSVGTVFHVFLPASRRENAK